MKSATDKHKLYLRKKFKYACSREALSENTTEVLDKYGAWMHALSKGQIPTLTTEQKMFVDFHQGMSNASTKFEIAWLEYRLECLFEQVKQFEKKIGNPIPYYFIKECFLKLSSMGHTKSKQWLLSEGTADKSPYSSLSHLDDIDVRKFYTHLEKGETSATGYGPGPDSIKTNWSNDLDDFGTEDWENYLGGPDID